MNTEQIFESFKQLNVLVVGDVMIDSYIWGKVDRISPEAPVPVVNVNIRENRLGGAANVAKNIKALNATPYLCSVVGNDEKGRLFLDTMKKAGMNLDGIYQSDSRTTTTKTRVIGNQQQILRVDQEVNDNLNTNDSRQLIDKIKFIINNYSIHAMVIEDYDKGLLSEQNLDEIISVVNKNDIPVAVDPKKRNFNTYSNVTLFKPNLKELVEGLKLDKIEINKESIEKISSQIRKEKKISMVLTTLSDKGIFYSINDEHDIIPAHVRNVSDVSGAGDTVISVAALCMALKLPANTVAQLSNLAGGIVCEYVGVVPIDAETLKAEAIRTQVLSSLS